MTAITSTKGRCFNEAEHGGGLAPQPKLNICRETCQKTPRIRFDQGATAPTEKQNAKRTYVLTRIGSVVS